MFFSPAWEPAAMGHNLVVGVCHVYRDAHLIQCGLAPVSHRRGRGSVQSTLGVCLRGRRRFTGPLSQTEGIRSDSYSSYKGRRLRRAGDRRCYARAVLIADGQARAGPRSLRSRAGLHRSASRSALQGRRSRRAGDRRCYAKAVLIADSQAHVCPRSLRSRAGLHQSASRSAM
jgi:hypothetical protein